MSDFVAQIRATLDTKQAQSDFNSFKSKIESEIINLKVKFDDTGKNSSFDNYLNNIQKQAQTAGKGIGTSLQQGIKGVKFNGNSDTFIKHYLEQMKRDTKEAESVAKKFDVSQKDASKAVNARNSAAVKANNDAIKEQKRQQKEIDAIESARIKSSENAKKREEKIIQNQNNAINKSLENDYKQQQKNIEQRQQLISKQAELLGKNKKTLSSSLSNNSYANAKDIKEAKDLLQLINTTDLNKYNEPAKRVEEIASQVSKVTSKLSESHKLNLDNLNKEIAAEEKANIQNLKYIQQGEESQKRIQVQQQIATLKANAVQKNAHNNELVQQGKDNIAKWKQQYEEQNNYAEKLEATQKRIATLRTNTKSNTFESMYGNTAKYKDIENNLSKIEQLQSRINSEMAKGSSKDTSKINTDLKEMTSLLSKSENAFNNLTKPINEIEANIAANKTESWLKENTKAAKELGNVFDDIAEKQRKATTAGELENYNKQFKEAVSYAQANGLTGKSPFDEFKRAASQIAQFTGIYGVLQNVMQDLPREMVQAVRDVDTAMTNLYKVTDETDAKYQSFLKNAGTTSKQLGRDMSSYITQTSEWAKLGYSMAESADLAKLSSIYANVGEVSDSTAVSDMVTAMKAFNIEASNAMSIADAYNALGNKFASDAASIGEGISNAASSLATSGNDFNQSVAMITGMAEITQDAGEAGNALKILSMRIRGYDEETETYSNSVEELTGKVADLTKTADTPGGISLFSDDAKETYKSTFQIMKEISKVWDDLTDKNRAELTEVLAGKNRGNQITALMQAFQSGQVQKAYETAMDSQGSALEEQNRWMDSIDAKVQQFKSQFQELSTVTLNSDFLKGFVDTGTGALNILTQLISNFGTFKSLIASIGGGFLTKNGFGKRNAALYKIKQNHRRFINVESFLASNKNKPYSFNY